MAEGESYFSRIDDPKLKELIREYAEKKFFDHRQQRVAIDLFGVPGNPSGLSTQAYEALETRLDELWHDESRTHLPDYPVEMEVVLHIWSGHRPMPSLDTARKVTGLVIDILATDYLTVTRLRSIGTGPEQQACVQDTVNEILGKAPGRTTELLKNPYVDKLELREVLWQLTGAATAHNVEAVR